MMSKTQKAIEDFRNGLSLAPAWFMLSWQDIKMRYKRTALGPFWVTISLAISIVFMGLLYSKIFNIPLKEYLPYLTAGLVHWSLINMIILEGSTIFSGNEAIIRQVNIPLSFHIFRMLSRNILIWLHNVIVLVLVYLIFGKTFNLNILWIFATLPILCTFGLGLSILIGTLSTRYRDLQQIIASLTQLLFFITPIMWLPSVLKGKEWLLSYNIFYYYLAALRMPFDGINIFTDGILVFAFLISLITLLFAFLVFIKFRSKISYWV